MGAPAARANAEYGRVGLRPSGNVASAMRAIDEDAEPTGSPTPSRGPTATPVQDDKAMPCQQCDSSDVDSPVAKLSRGRKERESREEVG